MNRDITSTFENIYDKEGDMIFRFCLLKVSNREQALDITQETFLRLWQSLQDKKVIENERAFLFTVANRLIIDWYRKKKSVSLDKMEEQTHFDVPDIHNNEEIREGRFLLEKINELEGANREPVYLRFVEDLTPPEIGEILGITANAASVRINRGVAELRKKFGYDK